MSEAGEFYAEAVRLVTESGKPSASYLQRQLQIGFNVAASLVERMEREGLLSRPDHIGRRTLVAEPQPLAGFNIVGDSPLADAMREELARRGLEVSEPTEVEAVTAATEPTPAGVTMGMPVGTLSPVFFKGLVAEAERLQDMRADINEQMKALRDAAKARGVNLKAFSELLRRRSMDPISRNDLDESLAIYERVAGLTAGVIDGGELRALPAPEPPPNAAGGAKGKAVQEALAWASGGF